MELKKLNENADLNNINKGDVIIINYKDSKRFIGLVSRIDGNKIYLKESLNKNYIQETEIDLIYKYYIESIYIVY